jgi:PAS domain S-box-containing protein
MLNMVSRPTGVDADLFQALVEYSSDAILLLDEHGVIRYASRSTERVLGYTPEERLNKSSLDLIHPDDMPRVAPIIDRAMSEPGVPITETFLARHKDGSWRHIEAVAVGRLTEPAVGGIVVNYRDVTERWRAAEALRASDDRLRRLFETAPDIIYSTDAEGRFTYVNPTASRVMKYLEHELVGRHFLSLVRPDHRDIVKNFYVRQIADQTPQSYFEFPALTSDDETIWVGQHVQLVLDGGQVVGSQAICRDITKQKQAEERLRRSEARYRSLIQGAAHGLYRTTLDGRILDANPAFATMLGYDSVDELKAINVKTVYAKPEDREAAMIRHLKTPGRTISGDVVWKKRDGTLITVRATARLIDFEEVEGDGGTTFEGIAEDITQKRALEEQLRQSQKMEAVGRLARGIAHDFNNVLAAILGCADLMQLRLRPDSDLMVEAGEIARAAQRGAALTRQLLAFSRRQSVEPELLDLHKVLLGFDTMLQRIAGDITLRLQTPGPSPLVRMEPGQIEQVVMNLVLNARDASPPGGAIDVCGDIVTFNTRKYPGVNPGRYARIAVHDAGAGIDPDLQRMVFEPFFTTKDPSKGNGLGLSIVYGIAKEAGGTVTFTSPPGRGTTFEVFLPLTEPAA